jgi:hypothetical protein
VAYELAFDGPILLIRLHGTLTAADLDRVGDEMIALEQGGTVTPPRMTDLRGITEPAVGYAEVARLAERARTRPLGAHVRSALVVTEPVQVGLARMFQILNEHPQITLRIFEDEATAREWLIADP